MLWAVNKVSVAELINFFFLLSFSYTFGNGCHGARMLKSKKFLAKIYLPTLVGKYLISIVVVEFWFSWKYKILTLK